MVSKGTCEVEGVGSMFLLFLFIYLTVFKQLISFKVQNDMISCIKNKLSAFTNNQLTTRQHPDINYNSMSYLSSSTSTTTPHLNHPPITSYIQPTTKMRPSSRLLLATPASIGSKSSLTEARALLPPLQLYRRILRVHRRKLEPEMRVLGDSYVKSEFRLHKNVENPLHIVCRPYELSSVVGLIRWWMG